MLHESAACRKIVERFLKWAKRHDCACRLNISRTDMNSARQEERFWKSEDTSVNTRIYEMHWSCASEMYSTLSIRNGVHRGYQHM